MSWKFYDANGSEIQGVGVGAVATANIADDAVTIAKLAASGTASDSTFLRGDNAWAAASGGGKVLQAETAVLTTTQSISSQDDSLTDINNLTITITPAASTSKFLILVCIGKMDVNTNNNTSQFAVLRTPSGGSTTRLNTGTDTNSRIAMSFTAGTGQSNGRGGLHFSCLDSPNTTSAITYKVAASCHDAPSHPLYINRWRTDSNNGDGPSARTASSITVLEVGA